MSKKSSLSTKQLTETLEERESLISAIALTTMDSIFCKDINRRYTFVNNAMAELLGCDKKDILGKNPEEVFGPEAAKIIKEVDDIAFNGQKVNEVRSLNINGEIFYFHTVQVPMEIKDGKVISINGIVRDVTESYTAEEQRKRLIDELQQAHDELESRVVERTAELHQKAHMLEEANIALKVLMEKRHEDTKELEKRLADNITNLISPYIERLRTECSNEIQKTILNILQSNINEISAPFFKEKKNIFFKLTPMQIKIANLIKQGHSTKEIAAILYISPSTVAAHRQMIRKRLELDQKKINLRSAL